MLEQFYISELPNPADNALSFAEDNGIHLPGYLGELENSPSGALPPAPPSQEVIPAVVDNVVKMPSVC